MNAVLLNGNRYQFDCCGFISTWEIFARNGAAVSIDVKVQVWEDTGGTLWNLRGENTIAATGKISHLTVLNLIRFLSI